MSDHDAIVAIPARMESGRLPGKPLRLVAGRPLVWHTWRAASQWIGPERTYVVTDSADVAKAVREFAGHVIFDAMPHRHGSARIFAVADRLPRSCLLVNLQCDEPCLTPDDFDTLARVAEARPAADVATLCCEPPDDRWLRDPNQVKVVMDELSVCHHFTRSNVAGARLHVGVYAFRRCKVPLLSACRPTTLSVAERLEQLEWMGVATITAGVLRHVPVAVNTLEDLKRFTTQYHGDRYENDAT